MPTEELVHVAAPIKERSDIGTMLENLQCRFVVCVPHADGSGSKGGQLVGSQPFKSWNLHVELVFQNGK